MNTRNKDNVFPSMETERLVLQPMEAGHLDFVFKHFSDSEINRYILDDESVQNMEQAQEIIDFYVPPRKSYNRWVITLKADQTPIGTCGFHKWDQRNHHAEIGYDLGTKHWHKGYMIEALQAALPHGFEKMELNRIEAIVYPENIASLRLLKRLGFQQEGLLRQSFRQGDKYYDHLLLSLLKEEWQSL